MNRIEVMLKSIRRDFVRMESECTYQFRGETGRLIENRLDRISKLAEEIFDIQKHDVDILAYSALLENRDVA